MARIKYDIWIKPVENGSSIYKVRFTNDEALKAVRMAGITKGIYKEGVVIYRLNEWHSLPKELFNFIQYSPFLKAFNVKIEYAENSHFEHGL